MKLSEVRKFLTTALGACTEVISLNLLHGTAETVVLTTIPILTAVLTYVIPNKDPSLLGGNQ